MLLLLLLRGRFLLVSLLGLLLHGLLLLLLLGLLLHRLLLLLVLLLNLRCSLLIVVVIAAAHQGQAGSANARAGGRPQQRTARHAATAHPLPIVSLAHVNLQCGTVPPVTLRPTRSLPGQFRASYNTASRRTGRFRRLVHKLVQFAPRRRNRVECPPRSRRRGGRYLVVSARTGVVIDWWRRGRIELPVQTAVARCLYARSSRLRCPRWPAREPTVTNG